ncbi:MAG TPA: hypothetical protein VFJ45_12470 [bacterium]|nr:hypothetical protein [bacterium]
MRGKQLLIGAAVLLLVLPLLAQLPGAAAPRPRLPYWVMADVIRGDTLGAQSSIFKQGDEVVFRARVLDIATGQDPGRAGQGLKALQELGLKVTAYLEDGKSFPMTYGRHPAQASGREPVSWFWTASWRIPDGYTGPHDAGTLVIPVRGARYVKWWVMVTDKAGANVRWDPIGVGTNLNPIGLIIEKR